MNNEYNVDVVMEPVGRKLRVGLKMKKILKII